MQSTADAFEDLRKDFPVLNRRVRDNKKLVYFDNAATTQKPNQVIDAISDYYQNSKCINKRLLLNDELHSLPITIYKLFQVCSWDRHLAVIT